VSCENYAADYARVKPLLQICSISALSLHKKQSSTYNKYACGCFLCAPSIYTAYLQKAYGEYILCFGERRLVLRICGVSARHGYDYRAKNEIMQGKK